MRAHQYLVDNKNQHPTCNGEKTVPKYCIFLQHTFEPTYKPRYPKPVKDTIATYEHILWDSIPAKNVWALAKTTLNNLQISHSINAWKDIFRLLDNDYKDIIEDIRLIIKHNIVITSIYILTLFIIQSTHRSKNQW